MHNKPHTEESKRKSSLSHKGQIAWNKGKKNVYSPETRLKMSEAKKGKKLSEERKQKMHKPRTIETKQKISKSMKGKNTWMKGKTAWNKGISKTEETIIKWRESRKGYRPTEETKLKTSKSLKGHITSSETKKKISKSHKKLIQELGYVPGSGKSRNTKPELKAELILQKYNLNYKKQFRINYLNTVRLYDFYLPDYNILLEIDGTYWHSKGIKDKDITNQTLKEQRQNDCIKDKLAQDNGYTLIRIWSDELDQLDQYCDIMLFYRKKEVS